MGQLVLESELREKHTFMQDFTQSGLLCPRIHFPCEAIEQNALLLLVVLGTCWSTQHAFFPALNPLVSAHHHTMGNVYETNI